jgi:leucyl-tRNA synthetase
MNFNTAISTMMIFANHLASLNEIPKQAAETLVQLISPFAPHLGELTVPCLHALPSF